MKMRLIKFAGGMDNLILRPEVCTPENIGGLCGMTEEIEAVETIEMTAEEVAALPEWGG